jgi:tetratricopeptide (TPR) repeat protein
MAWQTKGDLDRAIADYDQAIRIDPKNTRAYSVRGVAWAAKGDLDRAIADYYQAIRLDPKNTNVYDNRGIAWAAKGDLDRAIADYDQAIRLDPKNSSWYFHRGLSNLYAGALPTALADLNQASELNPKHAYVALWLDIVNKRSNLPSRLAEAAKQTNMTRWPAPVTRLYRRGLSRSVNLRRVACKFHLTIVGAVELRRDFIFFCAWRQDFGGEHLRVVLGTIAEEFYVGVVPTAA